MEPIPDAAAWAVRADAWAQPAAEPVALPTSLPPYPAGTVEPASSRPASVGGGPAPPTAGDPALVANGVGWRSETSEWIAETETTRWRQTTEWRSSSGNSGWRTTTEAWQTGGNSMDWRPPLEPPTPQPAISGTAWPTPQQADDPSWASRATEAPAWQSTHEGPPWRGPAEWTQSRQSAQSRQQLHPGHATAPDAHQHPPPWGSPAEPTAAPRHGATEDAPWDRGTSAAAHNGPGRAERRRVLEPNGATPEVDADWARQCDVDDRAGPGADWAGPGAASHLHAGSTTATQSSAVDDDVGWPRESDRNEESRTSTRQRHAAAEDDALATSVRREPGDWLRQEREDGASGTTGYQSRNTDDPAEWLRQERESSTRATAGYRDRISEDWRRELAPESRSSPGVARRSSAAEFAPFRAPGTDVFDSGDSSGFVAEADTFDGDARRATGSAAVRAAGRASTATRDNQPRRELPVNRGGSGGRDESDGELPRRRAVGGPGPRSSVAATSPTRGGSTGTRQSAWRRELPPLDTEDDFDDEPEGPAAAVGFTVVWYGIPVVLLLLYALIFTGDQQSAAFNTLIGAAPRFGVALLSSMAVAVGIRRVSGTWKAASVGLAAAVVGGGLSTVVISAVTDQSLS